LDRVRELPGLDRLAQVVEGAPSQRLDRAVYGRVRREQHEIRLRVLAVDALEQIESREARHREIRDHDIGRLGVEQRECRLAAVAALDAQLFEQRARADLGLERFAHQLAVESVVVDDDDSRPARLADHLVPLGRDGPPPPRPAGLRSLAEPAQSGGPGLPALASTACAGSLRGAAGVAGQLRSAEYSSVSPITRSRV
jgi:hypothetical protein